MSKQDILDYFSDINHAYNDSTRLNTLSRMLDGLVEQAASPWHRVEEPPEPHKDVLVTGMEAINNSRVYKVMVNDNGTWRPTDYAPSIRWDYWMPIEPPKEEEV